MTKMQLHFSNFMLFIIGIFNTYIWYTAIAIKKQIVISKTSPLAFTERFLFLLKDDINMALSENIMIIIDFCQILI